MNEKYPLSEMIADQLRVEAAKHSAEMNERCQQNFREAVAKIDELERDCALRRLLYDVFGSRTYCVEVARG